MANWKSFLLELDREEVLLLCEALRLYRIVNIKECTHLEGHDDYIQGIGNLLELVSKPVTGYVPMFCDDCGKIRAGHDDGYCPEEIAPICVVCGEGVAGHDDGFCRKKEAKGEGPGEQPIPEPSNH